MVQLYKQLERAYPFIFNLSSLSKNMYMQHPDGANRIEDFSQLEQIMSCL